jgi:S-adenosylmethionine hydrolase
MRLKLPETFFSFIFNKKFAMNPVKKTFLIGALCIAHLYLSAQNNILVLQSDFGLKDGAVSAMKGVATGVSANLKIFDLTHEIPAYNIWEASYRLQQTTPYWPVGTVFVSVVDPGVGSQRKSVVLKTKTGKFFVTPDNGTLTLIAENMGIAEIREIDEKKNRRPGSGESYTFHGRDVYAYTGARLASHTIKFEEVGPVLPLKVVTIAYQKPTFSDGTIRGNVPILDIQYGNIWTNIDKTTFKKLDLSYGDNVHVTIYHNNNKVYEGSMPYSPTFSSVEKGKSLCYLNSLLNVSFALNEGNFSETYKVYSGADWSVTLAKQ